MGGQEKQALRAYYLERRKALSAEEYRARSAALCERLCAMPAFRATAAMLTYVASKDNEVDTCPLIRQLLDEERTVLVPVAAPGRSMPWSRLDSFSDLAPARFGLLEPRPERLRIAEPPAGSVVLVPGLAFTPQGDRIGYGGGYFDRFLAGFTGVKIGLAFDCQIAETLPHAPHDVRVDMVVTESREYRVD